MATKKINLKCSVNAINAKSAASGKKKALPKLKVILANPYKPKFETLVDNELSQFKNLIFAAVKSSGTSGRLFAKQNNIQLGLGSSLRAIGNKKASCVIISQSIKPKFIIDQIGCFTKQTNSTVPVFIVEDWDNISAKLFDIKALVVVFPLNVSGELGKWISKRTLTPKEKQKLPEDNIKSKAPALPVDDRTTFDLNSMYLTKPANGKRSFIPDVVVKSEPLPTKQSKDWTGDFISFSNKNEKIDDIMDMDEVDEEFKRKQDIALESLQRIAKRTQTIDNEPKTKIKTKEMTPKTSIQKKIQNVVSEEWENDTSYISLEVHKIQPNPNRKPKNKKKNKNKNKKKELLKLNKK